jgi:exodeoxyribonuclease-3
MAASLILTYNVNSLGARLPRLLALLETHQPDIALLQETKSGPEAFPHLTLQAAGYQTVDFSGGRWAGVAILVRQGLHIGEVIAGLPDEPWPGQARWLEAVVEGTRIISVYVPNGRLVGSAEFAGKLVFLEAMASRAGRVRSEPVVIAGDMNVCPTDLDVWDPRLVHGATHVTPDERERLAALSGFGFVDAFRAAHPEEPGFTWWDYRAGHFHKGFGLRIDLAFLSARLCGALDTAWVDRSFRKPSAVPGTKPSDHAPLLVRLRSLS